MDDDRRFVRTMVAMLFVGFVLGVAVYAVVGPSRAAIDPLVQAALVTLIGAVAAGVAAGFGVMLGSGITASATRRQAESASKDAELARNAEAEHRADEWRRASRARFLDVKRERYARLLTGANDWVQTLSNQRAAAREQLRAKRSWDGKPELGKSTDLWHLADEIWLLDRGAGNRARLLAGQVVFLGPFAVKDTDDLKTLDAAQRPWMEALAKFNEIRDEFEVAAAADLEKD